MHEAKTNGDYLEQIGATAGDVWTYLNLNGPVSLNKLMKDVSASRDLVMQGVGWLAREGKVKFEQQTRGRTISLV